MKFHCGELVYDKADPRHLGVVTAIRNGYSARVVWEDTGWISWVPLVDLRNGGEK